MSIWDNEKVQCYTITLHEKYHTFAFSSGFFCLFVCWFVCLNLLSLLESCRLILRIYIHIQWYDATFILPSCNIYTHTSTFKIECTSTRKSQSNLVGRNSSVGRALDWRSKGPRFNPGFRHGTLRRSTPYFFNTIIRILLFVNSWTFDRMGMGRRLRKCADVHRKPEIKWNGHPWS